MVFAPLEGWRHVEVIHRDSAVRDLPTGGGAASRRAIRVALDAEARKLDGIDGTRTRFCHRNVSISAFLFKTALYWKSPPGSRTEANITHKRNGNS